MTPMNSILPSLAIRQLMYADFAYFMSRLIDVDGRRLQVAAHHRVWCKLMTLFPRLVLVAPRGHSKTTTALAYVLWRFHQHGTDPSTGLPRKTPVGTYTVALFSATDAQARVHSARFRDLVAANPTLFPAPANIQGGVTRPAAASETHIRLASGAELLTRAYGTMTRGLHPDLLLCDDVLDDTNSGSEHKRSQIWHYFTYTLLPMHATQILIVGTPIHAADLLHRLSPRSPAAVDGQVLGFTWRPYQAINERTQKALWPEEHPYAEHVRVRDQEPTMFAREYQCDPIDDLSTYFPRVITQPAVDAGAYLTMPQWYHKPPTELVVLGGDLARSERIGADYTVAVVAAVDVNTRVRRVLTVRREKGLDFAAQLALFRDAAVSFGVDWGTIEDNGLQGWVVDELRKLPGGHVFHGHTTGRGKMRFDLQGIPMLKMALVNGLWVFPSGDEPCRELARIWQAELGAFGFRDGRVQGIGEHDDVVIASWKLEVALADLVHELTFPAVEYGFIEDIFPDWKPVRIGEDY
jgi:hypothetical protein